MYAHAALMRPGVSIGYFLLVGSANRVSPYFCRPSEGSASSLRRILLVTPVPSVVVHDHINRAAPRLEGGMGKIQEGGSPGVGPARLERATSCSGGKRSIQLSYGPSVGPENWSPSPLFATAAPATRRPL